MGCIQHAVWRNGGSNPAETAVQICKGVPRSNSSGSRHLAKPLGRCMQTDDSTENIDMNNLIII